MHQKIFRFIRELYPSNDVIPLHAPSFSGNESHYVQQTIDSTFVSSVGAYVERFENEIAGFCQSARAVAVVNGTSALQVALYAADVKAGDLVITQALTFVATCNAIHWLGAEPVFVDVSAQTLSLCPLSLMEFLTEHCRLTEQGCVHVPSARLIKAVVPMHTFGHPAALDELTTICRSWRLELVEDAAESLGSLYQGKHTGTFGRFGVLSFNGNKVITTGGGGMVLCAQEEDGARLKHITTTAKVGHPYEFVHDDYGFNFRMPNLNAALGCAQLEQLPVFLENKRETARLYQDFFADTDFQSVKEQPFTRANYWLNAVICPTVKVKQQLLDAACAEGIMLRPIWRPMHQLPMFQRSIRTSLKVTEWLAEHVVNLPSSVRGGPHHESI